MFDQGRAYWPVTTSVPTIFQSFPLLSLSQTMHIPSPPCCPRDAKLSVLEWDPSSHTLRTRSLHTWEGRGALTLGLREGRRTFALPPRAVTDPMGR